MFRFIRGKGQQPSLERQKLQKELFAFRKTLQHGFPNKPSALAWDAELRILCVGTTSGAIKVYGRPGVEFYGQHAASAAGGGEGHTSPPAVSRIVCLPNAQGRIVSLCDDNSLHLWEITQNSLVEVKSLCLEGKLKKISAISVEDTEDGRLLLGTEGGNIYLVNLPTFTMAPDIIYQDVVMQNVPEDFKVNPGAVECICPVQNQPDQILIGYTRGLIVLWSCSESRALKSFVSSQQLEHICWNADANHFTSCHNDGSYIVWDVTSGGEKPSTEPVTAYGPFPCKAITKIDSSLLNGKPLVVFAGGLPRTYSDKFSVTAINDKKHVTFDFTSKIIDFVVISSSNATKPDTLIVLAEEELVAIDLLDENWRMLQLPYLVSLHASSITCTANVSGISKDVWAKLHTAGKSMLNEKLYSNREWPIDGGIIEDGQSDTTRELLLTGHEDGSVRFWDASGVVLTALYKFQTAALFVNDDEPAQEDNKIDEEPEEEEEEWPPFRKTGVFDPYSDDPRLGIKKIAMCSVTGTLLAAGTAGHVVVAKLISGDEDDNQEELKVSVMDIVCDRDGFVWKGHEQLKHKSKTSKLGVSKTGFVAKGILQLKPPAAITCVALHSEWGLLSAGTAHGLALYDYVRYKPVLVKCTLNPNADLSAASDTPISRGKSFKKSLRESFRRLRKGRSQRRPQSNTTNPSSPPTRKFGNDSTGGPASPLEARPVERAVEARAVDDSFGSMVRCLYFAKTFLTSVQNTSCTVWAGTNNGTVLIFTIQIPLGNKRLNNDVVCQLAKEIQLKHHAPVIGISVLDGASKPLPEPMDDNHKLVDNTQPHRVIIASEEQFKLFTLPSLKAFCKYKLTANEGARVRKMAFANFTTKQTSDKPAHIECCLLCLTNLGDCLVLSVPELKRQVNAAVIRREDINGISSLVFTKQGEALYLHSSSELQRISVSASHVVTNHCYFTNLNRAIVEPNINNNADVKTAVNGSANDAKEELTGSQIERARTPNTPGETQVNGDGIHESSNASVTNEAPRIILNGDEREITTTTDAEASQLERAASTLGINDTITSSVGDITIDSVKEHLTNSSLTTLSVASNSSDNATTVVPVGTETVENVVNGVNNITLSRTTTFVTQQNVVKTTTTHLTTTSTTNNVAVNNSETTIVEKSDVSTDNCISSTKPDIIAQVKEPGKKRKKKKGSKQGPAPLAREEDELEVK